MFLFICSICYADVNRPITLIVPYSPGGPTDLMARYLQTDLENILHTTVVVKNSPGSGNLVAINQLLSSDDCCTFIISQDDFIHSPLYQKNTSYQNFTATNIIGTVSYLMYGKSNRLRQEIQEKQTINVGNNGINGGADLWMSGITSQVKLNHIYYKGASDVMRDVTGGQCEYGVSTITASYNQVKEKTLVPVMISSQQRNRLYPQVPTYLELGFRGAPGLAWFGIFAKKSTDPILVKQVSRAVKLIVDNNSKFQDLQTAGMDLVNLDAKNSDQFYLRQIEHFKKQMDKK